MGEEIRKEKDTPKGSPAAVNPIKIGMEEQEQKGVTVPKRAATRLAESPRKYPSIFFVLSGGKKLCT